MYRLLNPLSFAAGQLAVFQGASEVPISESYGSSEQRGKTANATKFKGFRDGTLASRTARTERRHGELARHGCAKRMTFANPANHAAVPARPYFGEGQEAVNRFCFFPFRHAKSGIRVRNRRRRDFTRKTKSPSRRSIWRRKALELFLSELRPR